ncbi:MAG TPA: hypothetical protein VLU47_12125, partial [Blastocatellia bacterium]|nr:hypothetical protein [Blastocatellia bacterium]
IREYLLRYLLPDEEARLWEVLERSREHLRPMVSVLLYAGLRDGELLGLKVVDVDLNRHRIAEGDGP